MKADITIKEDVDHIVDSTIDKFKLAIVLVNNAKKIGDFSSLMI